jgi:hypothetical protein
MRELPTSSPDWRPINPNSLAHFFFNDPTSPEDVSHKEDKGAGGYYDYSLTDDWTDPKTLQYHNATYEYQTIVHFKPERTIWLVSYFCLKSATKDRFFSQDEIDYLIAMTAIGKAFKEVPHEQDDHCVAGLWKLYRSTDGTTEATVGYTLDKGKLEAFSVQLRTKGVSDQGLLGWFGQLNKFAPELVPI